VRRIAVLAAVSLGAFGLLVEPALATFHLNMVNEVMLASSSGDANVQFVEFLDNGGTEEQFTPVFGPYKLVIYDAAGNKLGEHTLNPTGLRAASAADREYLVSTQAADAAFGVTGDEKLDVTLPQGAGQACFEANPNPPAFSCLTWGTITKAVPTNSMGTGSVHGPTAPNGESDQRQPDGSVVAATPTPKARNTSTSSGGSGGMGTGGNMQSGTFAGVGFGARTASVSRSGSARVALTCPAGSGGCSGRLTLSAAKHMQLGSARFRIAAGSTRNVTVKLSKAARKLLARKRKLRARAVVAASDAAGVHRTSSGTVKLVASRH
jgi:hypothetical protein